MPWLGLLVVCITAAIYSPVVGYDFVVWDDALHVYANPRLHPVTLEHLVSFWVAPYQHLYIPLTYTVWAALEQLNALLFSALSPTLFHSFNLLCHLGSTFLVYRVGNLLGFGTIAAAMAAAVFALHPLQVEAVTWVSGLKDVLCGWWALVAVWQTLVYMQAPWGRRRWGHYWLATIAFLLALGAKPAAVVVPAIVGILAVGSLGLHWRLAMRLWGWWCIVALAWSIWTKEQQPDAFLSVVPSVKERLLVAADAVWFYLGKVIWPVGLGPDYGRTLQMLLAQGVQWNSVVGVLGCIGVLWWSHRRVPGLALGGVVFGVSLLPVLGLVPFAFQAISTVADRYTYLALSGIGLSVGWTIQRLFNKGPMAVVGAVVIGLLAIRSAQQVHVWRETDSLLTHTLTINPHSLMAHNNLGLFLAQQGNVAAAIAHYQRALQINPSAAEVHYNLGNAWQRRGNRARAFMYHHQAVRLKPTWAEAHNNLGSTLDDLGYVQEAIRHYQTAIQLKPQLASAYNNLGDAFLKQGHVTEAADQFRTATRLQPTWAEAHYNLGIALTKLGMEQDAIAAYRTAVAIKPHWLQAMLPLAWLLTTQQPLSPQAASEAIPIATQASHIPGPHQAVALYTLALAHQTTGNAVEALLAAQQAREHAKATGDNELTAKIEADFPRVREKE